MRRRHLSGAASLLHHPALSRRHSITFPGHLPDVWIVEDRPSPWPVLCFFRPCCCKCATGKDGNDLYLWSVAPVGGHISPTWVGLTSLGASRKQFEYIALAGAEQVERIPGIPGHTSCAPGPGLVIGLGPALVFDALGEDYEKTAPPKHSPLFHPRNGVRSASVPESRTIQ
jgi:hypothetical protein